MYTIYPEKLKKHLIKKLKFCYIFLGNDLLLLKNNEDLILNYANQKGFSEKLVVNIEQNKDWEKIINFQKKQNLFVQKTVLIINFTIKKLNITLIKSISKISFLLNIDLLIILKFNHLSKYIQKNIPWNTIKCHARIVSCFTPYDLYFINWIKYEIKEKNIKIEDKAFFLLCKYYEGNTLFIDKILNILLMTWPNNSITVKKIKNIIIDFFDFFPFHWINAIFEGRTKQAMYILNVFYEQKYNILILIRSLQKDLLILTNMKRAKNISTFLQKNDIRNKRYNIFINAFQKYNNKIFLQAIKLLVKIEINIKKKYNHSLWQELQELTLILC